MEERAPQLLRIETLGTFRVSVGGVPISDNAQRSGHVWKLFKYLITHRSLPVPTDRLVDMLWPEDEVDNPVKALYSLMYRLRALLNEHFDEKQEFILFAHNSYQWNKNAPAWVDADAFEALCKRGQDRAQDALPRIAWYEQAFALYGGDYLAGTGDSWVLPPTNYYKRLYTALVTNLSALCAAVGDYKSVVTYSETAVELDPFEEAHHIALIDALLHEGQVAQALAHYDHIVGMLNRELGVAPGERLQELRQQIYRYTEDVTYDLSVIMDTFFEPLSGARGAFFCNLDTFREVFQIEQRAMQRSGLSVYLACLSVTTPHHNVPTGQTLTDAIAVLKDVVLYGLRRGDVVTQYSRSQLLLLLPTATYESCEMVLQRLSDRFFARYREMPVLVHKTLQLVQAPSAGGQAAR